jgi:hypothetical protein
VASTLRLKATASRFSLDLRRVFSQSHHFCLEPELLEALHYIKERDGIPVIEQVRRALREWLADRDVTIRLKADRPRASTRERP